MESNADELVELRRRLDAQEEDIAALRAELAEATAQHAAALTPLCKDVALLMRAGIIVVGCGGCGHFDDVNKALAACADGDTVLLRPGMYATPLHLTRDRVTVRGTARGEVIFDGGDCETSIAVVSGTSVLRNLVFRSSSRTFPAARVTGPGGAPVFEDCDFCGGGNLSCVVVDGAAAPSFSRCAIRDSQKFGIEWRAAGSRGRVSHCTIAGCAAGGLVLLGSGASIDVERCEFGRTGGSCVAVRGERCLVSIDQSVLRDAALPVVAVAPGATATITKSHIFGGAACGILAGGTVVATDTRVFDNELSNVVVECSGAVTMQRCKLLSSTQHGIVVRSGGTAELRAVALQGNLLEATQVEAGASLQT